ncbi:MAG: Mur ligase family protein [Candidatus Poseidoniaceae archaeon]|jgi:dihydrofolate synthase/folylpolyglutamate synthase|nr:Mur ligase family protein [Candidatus Poseidoniaceae archaeon]
MIRDWLEGLRSRGISLALEATKEALNSLNNPQLCAPAIHVAGSNGKGTACAIISTAMILSGKKTGTFTSPHIARVEERIRIDGIPIAPAELDTALRMIRGIDKGLTFFETTWIAACILFEQHNVDMMVVEVGLGGRLDATRTCKASACLVTSISLEHTDILGDSIRKIALEKAAIASECPVLVMKEIEEGKEDVETRYNVQWVDIEVDDYRQEAAILAEKVLRAGGFEAAANKVPEAAEVIRWPARMQRVKDGGREFLLDSAHNPSGMERFIDTLAPIIKERGWSLLFGSSPQAKLNQFLQPILRLMEMNPPIDVVCTEARNGRYPALAAESFGFGRAISDVEDALASINGDFIVSCGSLYLQGEILSALGMDTDHDLSLL